MHTLTHTNTEVHIFINTHKVSLYTIVFFRTFKKTDKKPPTIFASIFGHRFLFLFPLYYINQFIYEMYLRDKLVYPLVV